MASDISTILVLGGPRVGKTNWMFRLTDQEFEARYFPTMNLTGYLVDVTHRGSLSQIRVLDLPGRYEHDYEGDIAFDAAVMIFDLTQPAASFESLKCLYRKYLHDRNVPLILCGNKNDLPRTEVDLPGLSKPLFDNKDIPIVFMSSKLDEFNLTQPLLYLLDQLYRIKSSS